MMRAVILATLFFGAIGTCCTAQEQLHNRGFESGDFSGWDTKGQGWSISDQTPSEGVRYAVCAVKKGEERGLRVCMQKIGPVQEGRVVEVSLDVAALDVVRSPNSKACIAVLCTDSKGGVRKEYRSNIDRPSAKFQHVEIDDAVVLPGTADIYIMIVVEIYQTALDDDWWRFDNVTVRIR